MKKAIENFVNKLSNGLMILNPPTGYGKTYQAFDYIAGLDFDNPATKKVVFITPYKKNLKESELREAFIRHDNLDQFKKYYMFFDNKVDAARKNFLYIENANVIYKGNAYPISTSIYELKEFGNLIKLTKEIEVLEKKKNDSSQDDITFYDELLKNKIDQFSIDNNTVQRHISKLLDNYDTVSAKIDTIRHNTEFKWIGFLYPEVFLSEVKILFMSVDKFLYGISSIVDRTINYYNSEFMANTVLFIDEFDDSREVFLKYCIEQTLDKCKGIDYINLFNRINSCLNNKKFTDENWSDKIRAQFESLKKKYAETYRRYSLQFDLKTTDTEHERNFLFDDGRFQTIAKDKCFIYPKVNKKNKVIDLKFKEQGESRNYGDYSLVRLLYGIRYCINKFVIFCRSYAYELSANNSTLPGGQNAKCSTTNTLEDYIKSVISDFEFTSDSNEYRYLLDLAREYTPKYSSLSKVSNEAITGFFDRSVYVSGYRYFDFIDADDHIFQTHLNIHDLYMSPEKILLHIVENANVIGLSATSLINTCITNFDLEYLHEILGNDFYEIPDKDAKRIKKSITKHLDTYKNIDLKAENITCADVDDADQIKLELLKFVGDKKLVEELSQELIFKFDDYEITRLIKTSKAVSYFFDDDALGSMIAFLPKLFKKHTKDYKMLIRILGNKLKTDKSIVCLATEGFDKEYEKIQNHLASGEKVCVLTSYKSLGSGQNLTYKAPNEILNKLVRTFNRPNKDNIKDFDCVYIEKPTNVVPNPFSDKYDIKNLVKDLFFFEACKEAGELSQTECWSAIRQSFFAFTGDAYKKSGLMKTNSYNNSVLRIIVQAVGRITRSNLKNHKIRIFVDEDIVNNICFSNSLSEYYKTEEMSAIESLSKSKMPEDLEVKRIKNKQLRDSQAGIQNITNFLQRDWSPEYIDGWKKCRELALKHPTVSSFDKLDIPYQHGMYITFSEPVNSYSYTKNGDFKFIEDISTNDNLPSKVSDKAINLKNLMKINFINELFDEKGYAKSFEKGEKILSPAIFNNIYKGALGEAIGYRYFENYINVKLKELPQDIYERFDNKFNDDVYVDFKYWNEMNEFDEEEQHNKIVDKLNECHGRFALVVNTSIVQRAFKIKKTTLNNKIIYEIPNIYSKNKDGMSVDAKTVENIKNILKKEGE